MDNARRFQNNTKAASAVAMKKLDGQQHCILSGRGGAAASQAVEKPKISCRAIALQEGFGDEVPEI